MKLKLLIAALTIFQFAFSQPCKEVVAYYPGWQWYDRNKLVEPNTIDYSKYTVINYAFFAPQANGTIIGTDSWADENILLGDINWSTTPATHYPNTSLPDVAHNNNVKVLISVGGWTLSDEFPQIAANATKRATFAGACRQLIDSFNLDGIDIDWEYPGYSAHSGTASDKQNYTLFLQQIRDSLTARGLVTGKTYLLTACFGASAANASNIEWNSVSNILDMMNLMTYDFFGSWDAVSNHNAPLHSPLQGDPSFNVDSAFVMLTQVYNVPASKINIGIAFYGRSVTGCTALHGTQSGNADATTFPEDLGMPMYYNILPRMNQFTFYWDNTAMVPYLLGNSIQTFVSYDDEKSIALKAEYIVNNNARGAIIWEITGDYIETGSGTGIIAGTPLADTLNAVLCSTTTSAFNTPGKKEMTFEIFPNPNNGNFCLNISNPENATLVLKIYNGLGELVLNKNLGNAKGLYEQQLKNLSKGIYFCTLDAGKKSFSKKLIIE
ncbi:MAG: T9SS type A sorting domain-containing protein [Bacteroidia bacterium]|nr:T9SS type A sorting domain-containing protein [Bacteroidia bacterium]